MARAALNVNAKAVTGVAWRNCPLLTCHDVPEVAIALIDRLRERPWGAG